MSDSDQQGTKRCCSISESPTIAKKFKECPKEKEENESSSKFKLSYEELQWAMPFEKQNITLNVGGKQFNVRKEHLVSESPVFDRMLNSNFKEATLTEIPLSEKNVGHFVRFLRYILPGFTDELKEDTVHDIVQLADKYQTEALKQRIDIFLAKLVTDKGDKILSQDIVKNLLEAELYNLPSYLNQCINVAARKLSHNLTKCQGYQVISKDTRLKIYTMRCSIIDACLNSGTLYNPENPFTPKGSYYPRYYGNEFNTDSIHVGMQKTDGENLKTFLQKN